VKGTGGAGGKTPQSAIAVVAQINGGEWKDYVEGLRTGWLEPALAGRDAQAQRPALEKLVVPRGIALYSDGGERKDGGERTIVDYERAEQLVPGEVDERDARWTRVTVKGTNKQLWARTDALSSSAG